MTIFFCPKCLFHSHYHQFLDFIWQRGPLLSSSFSPTPGGILNGRWHGSVVQFPLSSIRSVFFPPPLSCGLLFELERKRKRRRALRVHGGGKTKEECGSSLAAPPQLNSKPARAQHLAKFPKHSSGSLLRRERNEDATRAKKKERERERQMWK